MVRKHLIRWQGAEGSIFFWAIIFQNPLWVVVKQDKKQKEKRKVKKTKNLEIIFLTRSNQSQPNLAYFFMSPTLSFIQNSVLIRSEILTQDI